MRLHRDDTVSSFLYTLFTEDFRGLSIVPTLTSETSNANEDRGSRSRDTARIYVAQFAPDSLPDDEIITSNLIISVKTLFAFTASRLWCYAGIKRI